MKQRRNYIHWDKRYNFIIIIKNIAFFMLILYNKTKRVFIKNIKLLKKGS